MDLKNETMADWELLPILAEVADADSGLILAADVADRLEVPPKNKQIVTARISAMKRIGYLDRIDARSVGGKASDPPRYILTEKARLRMSGHVSATVRRSLDREDGTRLLVLREIAERGYVGGDDLDAAMLRREWQYQLVRRPRR